MDDIEQAAKNAATKLFQAIQASEGDIADRYDLTKLAGDAIVSVYNEGLHHGKAIYGQGSSAPPTRTNHLTIK